MNIDLLCKEEDEVCNASRGNKQGSGESLCWGKIKKDFKWQAEEFALGMTN